GPGSGDHRRDARQQRHACRRPRRRRPAQRRPLSARGRTDRDRRRRRGLRAPVEISPHSAYIGPHSMSADTALMPIPGPADPIPVPRAVSPRADGRVELVGLTKSQVRATLEDGGLDQRQAKLRAKQIWHWIYNRGVSDFDQMTDIAKAQRPWLIERFVISRPEVVEAQVSLDGTRKWLLKTHDGHEFEMVFIPDADRGTLCVSSQVGCTLNCRFCATGTMQLVRNLEPGEIVGQVMLARDSLGEW